MREYNFLDSPFHATARSNAMRFNYLSVSSSSDLFFSILLYTVVKACKDCFRLGSDRGQYTEVIGLIIFNINYLGSYNLL